MGDPLTTQSTCLVAQLVDEHDRGATLAGMVRQLAQRSTHQSRLAADLHHSKHTTRVCNCCKVVRCVDTCAGRQTTIPTSWTDMTALCLQPAAQTVVPLHATVVGTL